MVGTSTLAQVHWKLRIFKEKDATYIILYTSGHRRNLFLRVILFKNHCPPQTATALPLVTRWHKKRSAAATLTITHEEAEINTLQYYASES